MQSIQEKCLNKESIKEFLKDKQSEIPSYQILQSFSFLKEYDFLVIELIDTGSFGVIMKAIDESNENRIVAIKLMIVTNQDHLKQHISEYQRCLKVKHPNVIRNYQQLYDEENECFFIVSEFCEKGNLFSYFKKNNLTNQQILNITTQIIEGLLSIHEKNIIHSDLKPQNILITNDLSIKICDLGMSQQILGSKSHTLGKGGSLDYMAPEQIEGKLSKQSDIYALGCIICFLCKVNIFGLNMVKIKQGILPSLEDCSFQVLASLALKMMDFDPKKRYELKNYLEQIKYIRNKMFDNPKEGYEVQYLQDGDIFYGQLKDGKRQGKGECSFNEQDRRKKYEGEWNNGVFEGYGLLEWRSGDIYEGQFKNGIMCGKGVFLYSEQNQYECQKYYGEWNNNKKEGYGILQWKLGDRYEGYFKNGFMNGKGVYLYGDQGKEKKYDGEWNHNKREGYGILELKSGDKYEGYFKDDLKNGKGVYFYNQQNPYKCEKYDGEWNNNKKEGYGIFHWRSGEKYEGGFKNDLKNGRGKFYFKNGQIKEGEWINDVLVNKN